MANQKYFSKHKFPAPSPFFSYVPTENYPNLYTRYNTFWPTGPTIITLRVSSSQYFTISLTSEYNLFNQRNLAGKFHECIGRIFKMCATTRHSCMGKVTIGPMWTNKIVNADLFETELCRSVSPTGLPLHGDLSSWKCQF